MPTLFDGDKSDSDDQLKINTDYANNYSNWRQKEELHKLETKYGEDGSSSSDEDEEGNELTEEFEKEFYKTLSYLKNKDPKIYDEKTSFFQNDNKNINNGVLKKKVKKEKALTLREYERKIITERGGKYSDSEEEDKQHDIHRTPTYVEEQKQLKDSIKVYLQDNEQEDEADLLKVKERTEGEKKQEEKDYKEWLKGQQLEIDEKEKEELKPLRDFWNDPNLDTNEKFLRDYVLNNQFLDKQSNEGLDYDHMIHDSDENLSADENNIEKQEEFEHKYNFRFEEPDQEFIKRYPRTMENSVRKKDTRRAQKRAELKKRKEEDKLRKKEELKQLKALKRKEIEEKIEKIKEVTGNDDVQFHDSDFEADFDPAEHDKKMKEIFNDDYYAGTEENMKPEFPEIDNELGIEPSWDDYDPNNDEIVTNGDGIQHCEDPDFNMDADYDPSKDLETELIQSTKKRKRRRRSKFAELIAKEKPIFDPQKYPSYEEYFDQYYSLDYEDMIGDLPCRFKYRKVVPNDYGLSVEEVLMADDRELNKWCPLKRALQFKPEDQELEEIRRYKSKGKNEDLKRKVLTSLYKPPETDDAKEDQQDSTTKKKRRRKKKGAENYNITEDAVQSAESVSKKEETVRPVDVSHVNKNGAAETGNQSNIIVNNISPEQSTQQKSKKKKKKRKREESVDTDAKKHKKNADSQEMNNVENSTIPAATGTKKSREKSKHMMKKNGAKKFNPNDPDGQLASMNAERLKTYGINAKKFKNKLKYGMKK